MKLFTDWGNDIIISISIIAVFLILFTYIFNTEGHSSLNAAIIITAFIGLPIFILMYLDIPNSLQGVWGGILMAITVVIFGVLAIYTIVKLNFVEVEYINDDERSRK
ncbi:MAG: hypothetical protein E7Z78_05490 [Methanobrevibacter thaueri]|uniref:hypothetical protein n=1 Tax=Methanobrevibacter thaueri TaxID=190975 RepID=UPI001D75F9DD|nr:MULTISPECIES: hypothetical protein [Methanobrevibacter]MBE6491106.1 hypothetical protein [Methanobrevibacter sp.]MBE6495881.1 hypothetical protein [Methanobrevibacter thaueri]